MQQLEDRRLSELVPPHDWELCRPVIRDAEDEGILCAIGGGLAFSFYSGRRRNTKDVDLLVRPANKDRVIAILGTHGFEDFYPQEAYDRSWIYRGFRDGVIVDIIWTLPNHRFDVDDDWFRRSKETTIHGQVVKLITIEDLIRVKLYVLQRGRSDWPDVMNLIYAQPAQIQWRTLICLLDADAPLLGALLQVFAWMEPIGAREIPREVWAQLGLRAPDLLEIEEDRKFFLDTQDWFGPTEGIATC
jgi:hypothetical protein